MATTTEGGGFGGTMGSSRRQLRFVAIVVAGTVLFGTLAVRMTALQVVHGAGGGSNPAELAQGHQVVERPITPDRGLILDRQGRVLAKNVATYSVEIVPGDLPLPSRPQVLAELGAIIKMDPARITMMLDRVTGSMWDPVRIANNIDESAARLVDEEHDALPGVQTLIEAHRVYPFGAAVSHVVGYVARIDSTELATLSGAGYSAKDYIGRAGVESTYETELRGTPGVQALEVDARGRVVRDLGVVKSPVPGKTLVLTIDMTAQQHAYDALTWGLKSARNKHGVVAAMDPQTGEVIALASYPSYDNNDFATGITNEQYRAYLQSKFGPLVDAAVAEQDPPGSTYKLVTYSCALQNHLVGPNERLSTPAYVEVGGEKFYEWNKTGFGRTMTPAVGFSFSSAVVTYQLAQRIKIDRLSQCGHAWGFGAPTGIDLPGEVSGVVPDQAWAQGAINRGLYDGEVLQSALGQGYDLVTPIQLLNAYAALANGGTLWTPHVALEFRSADGASVEPVAPAALGSVGMRADVLAYMRAAARLVVTNHYMHADLSRMPLDVVGKTGTAEYGVRDKKGRLPYHHWLAGFVAPTSNWDRTDARFAYVSFMFGSNTVGNAAVEVTKKFLQGQFGLAGDYTIPGYLRTGNYYGE